MLAKPVIIGKFSKKQICLNCFSIVSWDKPEDEFTFFGKKKVYCPTCGNMLEAELDQVTTHITNNSGGEIDNIEDLTDYDFVADDETYTGNITSFLQTKVSQYSQEPVEISLNKDATITGRVT